MDSSEGIVASGNRRRASVAWATLACALVAGCATAPPAIVTGSLPSDVKSDGLGGAMTEPLQQARCNRAIGEIKAHAAELAGLRARHAAELAMPPANILQAWQRTVGDGGAGTTAAIAIADKRRLIGQLDARMVATGCPAAQIEALMAANGTTK